MPLHDEGRRRVQAVIDALTDEWVGLGELAQRSGVPLSQTKLMTKMIIGTGKMEIKYVHSGEGGREKSRNNFWARSPRYRRKQPDNISLDILQPTR
jgi:hypothetical protein